MIICILHQYKLIIKLKIQKKLHILFGKMACISLQSIHSWAEQKSRNPWFRRNQMGYGIMFAGRLFNLLLFTVERNQYIGQSVFLFHCCESKIDHHLLLNCIHWISFNIRLSSILCVGCVVYSIIPICCLVYFTDPRYYIARCNGRHQILCVSKFWCHHKRWGLGWCCNASILLIGSWLWCSAGVCLIQ